MILNIQFPSASAHAYADGEGDDKKLLIISTSCACHAVSNNKWRYLHILTIRFLICKEQPPAFSQGGGLFAYIVLYSFMEALSFSVSAFICSGSIFVKSRVSFVPRAMPLISPS